MRIDEFTGHENILLTEVESGIQFKRKEGDSSFNYFTVVGLEPL